MFTTASVSFAGDEGFSYTADSGGRTDTYFFVSGSKSDGTVRHTSGIAVFGGDLVVSGTLYAEKQVIEVDENVTGSLFVSGALYVSRSASIKEDLLVEGETHLSGNMSVGAGNTIFNLYSEHAS